MLMLSVFITPWQKPCACQCASRLRRALAHRLEQGGVGVAAWRVRIAALGVVAVDDVVGQRAQLRQLVARREVLEVPEADEAGCDACHDGGGLHHLALHRGGRAGQGQRPRGGYAQRMHGLAAQKFADARAQHGTAIAPARIRCAPRALEPALPVRRRFRPAGWRGHRPVAPPTPRTGGRCTPWPGAACPTAARCPSTLAAPHRSPAKRPARPVGEQRPGSWPPNAGRARGWGPVR